MPRNPHQSHSRVNTPASSIAHHLLSFSDVLLPRRSLYLLAVLLSRASTILRLVDPSHQSWFSSTTYTPLLSTRRRLLVPLPAIMSSFAALLQRRRSLFSIRPYIVLRSSLHDNAALRFSPSRRGCNRASLSRSRYTRATDVCFARCPFLGKASAPSSLHSRVPAPSRCDEEKYALYLRCIHRPRYRASRRSRDVACSLFRLLPRSDCPSPSDIERIRRPSRFSPRRTSRGIAVAPITNT